MKNRRSSRPSSFVEIDLRDRIAVSGYILRAVENVFLKKRRLDVADLYEESLDRFGKDAVERWFSEEKWRS